MNHNQTSSDANHEQNKPTTNDNNQRAKPEHSKEAAAPVTALSRDKLEFLPAALEIQAAPPARGIRSLLWVVMSLLVILILWACWARIDIIATAQGKIVPSGQVKIIQPLEAGVVKTIFVKEGQTVKAGDNLIALDNTANIADVERLTNEWQGYTDDLARLQAFLVKLELAKTTNVTSIEPLTQEEASLTPFTEQSSTGKSSALNSLSQQSLLASSWQEYQAKLESIDSEIVKLIAEKKAIDIDVARLIKTLPLVIEREQSYSQLLTTSAVSRNQYLELKQLRIDQEENLNLQKARVEQINASIISAQRNRTAYISEIHRTTLQEINQLTRQSESLQQELNKATRLTQLRILTSPVDGIVEQLVVATIGGVVTPAQELLHIIPRNQTLEVSANLPNKDIGFVYQGQVAEIKIDSFPFTKYGVIDSEIMDVSADAIEDERLGLLFPLKASLKANQMNVNGRWINLKPGMTVTVEIKTGTRRLIEFLLAPLMKGVSEGARER